MNLEDEFWFVRVELPPDRSKYRTPPYWYPDDPLPIEIPNGEAGS